MNDDNVMSIAQLREFLKLSNSAAFKSTDSDEAYVWIEKAYKKFRYRTLKKKEKGIVKKYLMKMTGYSETQIDRLLARKKKVGKIVKCERTQPSFPRIYTSADVALLARCARAPRLRGGRRMKTRLGILFPFALVGAGCSLRPWTP